MMIEAATTARGSNMGAYIRQSQRRQEKQTPPEHPKLFNLRPIRGFSFQSMQDMVALNISSELLGPFSKALHFAQRQPDGQPSNAIKIYPIYMNLSKENADLLLTLIENCPGVMKHFGDRLDEFLESPETEGSLIINIQFLSALCWELEKSFDKETKSKLKLPAAFMVLNASDCTAIGNVLDKSENSELQEIGDLLHNWVSKQEFIIQGGTKEED